MGVTRRWTVEDLYWLILIVVYLWAVYDGPPLRMVGWLHVSRWAQKVAYAAGRVGLYAESKYYDATKGVLS